MRIPRAACEAAPAAASALYTIVAGNGAKGTLSFLEFDDAAQSLDYVTYAPLDRGASWIEPGENGVFYSLSENINHVYSLKMDYDQGVGLMNGAVQLDCEGPVHVHRIPDAIVASCYTSGSIAYVHTKPDGSLDHDQEPAYLQLPYAYEGVTPPLPNQDGAHAHAVASTDDGRLWVADLGSDSVWTFSYADCELTLDKEYKVPEGFGPRHLATPDGKHMYAIGEMANAIIALSEDGVASDPVSILPPNLPEGYDGEGMFAAELIAHPTMPTTLYASNRLQMALGEKYPDYELPAGDAVSIFTVETPGQPPKLINTVVTGCDFIRSMKTSPDGKFVAVGGALNGLVEVYRIDGEQKEEWVLLTALEDVESVSDVAFFSEE